jgi:hypothetical protein
MNRHAYILVANNAHGKTTIQRNLVNRMCGTTYVSLPSNTRANVTLAEAPRTMIDLSVTNRSFQEKLATHPTVDEFFRNHFQEASVAILSSHSSNADQTIAELISALERRFYAVTGVFLSNAVPDEVRQIAESQAWDDRILLSNRRAETKEEIDRNLQLATIELSGHVIRRFSSH